MKYAWIENNKVRDIVSVDPYTIFHKDIASKYNTKVEDTVKNNAELVDGVWINPTTPTSKPNYVAPEAPIVYPKVSPVEFKMLFTPQERIAIKNARANDEILDDSYSVLEDARLNTVDLGLKSVQDLLSYLVTLNLITSERKASILTGKLV